MAEDPFDEVVFDEAFVAGARRSEDPAEVRVRPRRWRWLTGRGAGLALALVLLLGALAWARATPDRVIVLAEPRLEPVRVEDGPALRPADSPVPLGTPPSAPSGGSTRFLLLDDDGEAVTYDPCRPIELVVDERTMPRGAEDLVAEAVAEVAELTGLSMVLEGTTEERPSLSRDPYQPDRYGERWAPVLVTWSDPDELDLLDGSVIGFAGSLHLEVPGQPPTYVSGVVALDGPDLELMVDDGRPDLARAVILHELAHLLGLDHVDDPDELMFPEQQDDSVAFGPGDRRGLAALGAGPCVPLR